MAGAADSAAGSPAAWPPGRLPTQLPHPRAPGGQSPISGLPCSRACKTTGKPQEALPCDSGPDSLLQGSAAATECRCLRASTPVSSSLRAGAAVPKTSLILVARGCLSWQHRALEQSSGCRLPFVSTQERSMRDNRLQCECVCMPHPSATYQLRCLPYRRWQSHNLRVSFFLHCGPY